MATNVTTGVAPVDDARLVQDPDPPVLGRDLRRRRDRRRGPAGARHPRHRHRPDHGRSGRGHDARRDRLRHRRRHLLAHHHRHRAGCRRLCRGARRRRARPVRRAGPRPGRLGRDADPDAVPADLGGRRHHRRRVPHRRFGRRRSRYDGIGAAAPKVASSRRRRRERRAQRGRGLSVRRAVATPRR